MKIDVDLGPVWVIGKLNLNQFPFALVRQLGFRSVKTFNVFTELSTLENCNSASAEETLLRK